MHTNKKLWYCFIAILTLTALGFAFVRFLKDKKAFRVAPDTRLLKETLPAFTHVSDKVLRGRAANLEKKLSTLEDIIKESFWSCKGMEIDFILQTHDVDDDIRKAIGGSERAETDKMLNNVIVASQKATRNIILKNRYDALFIEGRWVDGPVGECFPRMAYDSIMDPLGSWADIREDLLKDGVNLSSYETSKQAMIQIHQETVAARLASNRPSHVADTDIEGFLGDSFAGECYELLKFEIEYLKFGDEHGSHNEVTVRRLTRARSAYVLAKAIADMKRLGYVRGAIVFGSSHEDEFREMADVLGLKSNFWHTVPESSLETDRKLKALRAKP